MSVSIKDIARLAGVTVGTVSRALNGYSDISEKTKAQILKIVADTGYTPNINARTLSSKVIVILRCFFPELPRKKQWTAIY